MEKKLSLLRKFKVYGHRFCYDLLVFFRLNSWTFWGEKAVDDIFSVTNAQRELAILEQVLGILQDNVAMYEDDYDLTDPSLGYHGYFTAVYHMEKLRILQKQVRLFELLIEVLTKLEEGSPFEEATESLSKSERIILTPYLSTIVI